MIEDPRNGKATRHVFGEMIFISLAAILCGMDTCEDFVRFAKSREQWLRKWVELPNGVPCANTFLRLFAAIDPSQFSECIQVFVARINPELGSQLVALDGKTLRGSRKADEKTVQMVSAWAVDSGLTLAQQAVDDKSNEITAVPKLLRQLDLQGCVVSLDAMGTQRKIAIEIIHAGADYLLALKANHGVLHDEVKSFLEDGKAVQRANQQGSTVSTREHFDKGHGRLEERRALATDSLEWLEPGTRKSWLGLKSLLRIESKATLADGRALPALVDDDASTTVGLGGGATIALTGLSDGAPTMYTLTSGDGRIQGGEWTLEARNGNGRWTVLDQRSGEAFESARQTRPFRIAKPGHYGEYRLRLAAPGRLPLAEIELLAPSAVQ